ncbi:MAG: hypothetical protein KAG89_13615 [Fulvimarina manganoxydans]|uniref:hypothetical protein n=1 Tax=Fulvimarina manganoxydans TaxID=937218 RepID=UPI0023522F51|nr:hypothetical protein [Fulvimarina manganoxydans]MCK5933198.1 hypothetical protein [Fulvimarina manganoxydans]
MALKMGMQGRLWAVPLALVLLSSSALAQEGTAQTGDAAGSSTPSATAAPASSSSDEGQAGSMISGLSPLIEDVQIVGPWDQDGTKGVWRTVMARDPADPSRSHFFLQQIAGAEGGATLVKTIEITEIGEMGGAVVGYRADEPSSDEPSGLSLFFEIVPRDGEISETYELHVQPDGSYDFGFATN